MLKSKKRVLPFLKPYCNSKVLTATYQGDFVLVQTSQFLSSVDTRVFDQTDVKQVKPKPFAALSKV